MKRPVGVTASAIFSLLGSLLFIGLWVLLLVMLVFRQRLPPMPTEARLGLVISLVMFGGLGAWGFITGIGLLRLSNWARISMVVFSVLLAFMGLLSAPVFLLMPMSPKMPPNFATHPGPENAFFTASAAGCLFLFSGLRNLPVAQGLL